jgi:hypothetical protein
MGSFRMGNRCPCGVLNSVSVSVSHCNRQEAKIIYDSDYRGHLLRSDNAAVGAGCQRMPVVNDVEFRMILNASTRRQDE